MFSKYGMAGSVCFQLLQVYVECFLEFLVVGIVSGESVEQYARALHRPSSLLMESASLLMESVIMVW